MPGILPAIDTAGGVVIRDLAGNPVVPSAPVVNAYVPPATFVADCELTALPNNCEARISPEQINAIVSELMSFAECLDPNGPWNCASVQNLCAAFAVWANTGVHVNVEAPYLAGTGTAADPIRLVEIDGGEYV